MASKVFKTYRQLLSILRVRGIRINTGSEGSRAMRILEKENYYNVVNGYKKLFIATPATPTSDEVYKVGTSFDEIFSLYTFDKEIRIIFLKYLLKIENYFKTAVAHEYSAKYGFDNYLKLENFQASASTDTYELNKIARRNSLDIKTQLPDIQRISAEENIGNVTRLLGDIQLEIARQLSKHHQMVCHYMTKHGYIPLWVLVNVLTFGKVTAFYFNLKEPDKISIARQFNLHYKELHKLMSMLGFARNICAHDERFFDIRFTQRLHTNSIKNFSILKLPKDKSGSYTQGTCDAYAVAVIFSLLLSKSDLREFISSMDAEIKRLAKLLTTITVDDVLKVMGFPANWKDISKL